MSDEKILLEIADFIKEYGVCYSQAKTPYGADKYRLGKLECWLSDDGTFVHVRTKDWGISYDHCISTLHYHQEPKKARKLLKNLHKTLFFEE